MAITYGPTPGEPGYDPSALQNRPTGYLNLMPHVGTNPYGQPNPYAVDPGAASAQARAQAAQIAELGRISNINTAQAGQNENANRIGSLPAYGTAVGQATANEMNASQQARMASVQGLLKALGF